MTDLKPFVFKRRKFTGSQSLICSRSDGEQYAFQVNTRKHPERVYRCLLFVDGAEKPLTNFEMVDHGEGRSLISFVEDGKVISHTGDKKRTTLLLKSHSAKSPVTDASVTGDTTVVKRFSKRQRVSSD